MRALVLSSGGLKAGWQVGVMKGLAEQGTQWDVVCGCSAGSINAAVLAMYDVGQEVEAVNHLESIWMNYSERTPRPRCLSLKTLTSIMTGSVSVEKDDLLYRICDPISVQRIRDSDRQLYVLANSLSSGGHMFTSSYPELRKAVVASMSVPGMFPPQKLTLPHGKHEWFVDGAMSTTIPHFITNMEVDVISANSMDKNETSELEPPPRIGMNALSSLDSEMSQTAVRSIDTLKRNNKVVRLFQPPGDLQRKNFYDMNHHDVQNEIYHGYNFVRK
jgi:predicted acylesterase/phospholipase RssA